MRCIVVGYGVQGKKRLAVAASEAAGVVDPFWTGAQWKDVREVPLDLYDAAVVCTPDEPKMEILGHLAGHGKHTLTEKPLHAGSDAELVALEQSARDTGALLVTAYNHRDEPHYVGMRDLDRVRRARGKSIVAACSTATARLAWCGRAPGRDQGAGLLPDLGSRICSTR